MRSIVVHIFATETQMTLITDHVAKSRSKTFRRLLTTIKSIKASLGKV